MNVTNNSDIEREKQTPNALHAWCRWRTYINHFLIDRMKIGKSVVGRRHTTSYFLIMNGIEIPPALEHEEYRDIWLQGRFGHEDPKTLEWHLKHNIPRAKYKRRSSRYSSWNSVYSPSNSEVSYESGSGYSSAWTSYSSLDSDAEPSQTRSRQRRRSKRHHSERSLLTWSRLKLKLTQRKRRSNSADRMEPSSNQSSRSSSPSSVEYSGSSDPQRTSSGSNRSFDNNFLLNSRTLTGPERSGSSDLQHTSSGSNRSIDKSYSMNSRKFPLVSKIFLPDWSQGDRDKSKVALKQNRSKRLMKDGQGRVFVDVGEARPMDMVDDVLTRSQIIGKASTPVKLRHRLRMYGQESGGKKPADADYMKFMFESFQELYNEDIDKLTNLNSTNQTASTTETDAAGRGKSKGKGKHGNARKSGKGPGYFLQHYGKF